MPPPHHTLPIPQTPWAPPGSAQLGLDARKRINLDLSYEIMELRKDICFLEEGAETLYNKFMRPTIDDFDELVRRVCARPQRGRGVPSIGCPPSLPKEQRNRGHMVCLRWCSCSSG